MADRYDVCSDIVEYGRRHVIGNEQQFLATVLSFVSAYAPHPSEFIANFIVGELSGGKTHLQRTAIKLFPPESIYQITSTSDKAPIYSDALRNDKRIKIINFAEYQKLPKPVLEFLKSLSGDDDIFTYEYTKAATGDTERIYHDKKSYTVTYAQVDIDPELESRVFVIPIMENYKINRCVGLIKLGAKSVVYNNIEYIFEEDDQLNCKLMDAFSVLMEIDAEVTIPFPLALVDLVNHAKAVSKRHSNLIASLIKGSARLNWLNREKDDGKIIAGAQDVANVLCMFDVLRATMMAIDIVDMTIYKTLCHEPDQTEELLVEHLQSVGLAELTKTELGRRLGKLYDQNYIIKSPTSTGNVYSSNKLKQTLKLEVDWDEIYKHDKSQIKHVINAMEFKDIRDFGKYIESEHEIKESGVGVDNDKTVITGNEATARGLIYNWVSGSSTEKTRSKMIYGIMQLPDNQDKLGDINYYDLVEIIKTMVDESVINFNETTKQYYIDIS